MASSRPRYLQLLQSPIRTPISTWSNSRAGRLLDAMLAPTYMALLLILLVWPAIVARKPIHVGTNILHHDVLYRSLLPPHRWEAVTARSWDPASYLLTIPADVLTADYFQLGRLPLWNPYNGLGVPLLGDGELAPLSPLKLPLFVFPTMQAYSAYLLLCLYIAGLAAYTLARLIGLSRTGSLLAATSFSLSAWVLLHIHNIEMPPLVLLPLVLWVLEHLHRKPSLGGGMVVGLTMGFVSLTGHPEGALWTGVAGAFYVTLRVLGDAAGIMRRRGLSAARGFITPRVVALLLAILVFSGIAALTIVPLYNLITQASVADAATSKALTLVSNSLLLWRAVVPSVFLYVLTPDAQVTNLAEWNIYIGPLAVVLAAIGLAQIRDRLSNLAIMGLIGGGLVLPHAYNAVPMICGLALLSGRGLDALRVTARAHPRLWPLWRSGWSLLFGVWIGLLLPAIGLSWSATGASDVDQRVQWTLQGMLLALLLAGMTPLTIRLIRMWTRRVGMSWGTEALVVGVGCCLLLACSAVWVGREVKVVWAGFVAEGVFMPKDDSPASAWSARAWRSDGAWEAFQLIRPEPFRRFVDLGRQPAVIFEPDNTQLEVALEIPAWSEGDLLEFELPEGRVSALLRSGIALFAPAHVLFYGASLTVVGLMLGVALWRWPELMTAALVLFNAAVLLRQPPLGPQEPFSFEATPAIRWLQEHAGMGRVLSWPEPMATLAPITNAPQHISTGSLLAFFQSCRYRQVLDLANGLDRPLPCGPRIRTVAQRPGSPWSNLLGFRYVVTPAEVKDRPTTDAVARYRDDTVRIYEIGSALPRAWLVSDVRLVPPEEVDEVLYTLNTEAINPHRTAIVEALPHTEDMARMLAGTHGHTGQMGTATVVVSHPDIMEIHTSSSVPSLLITSDEFDPGWEVHVDDVRAIPLRADYLLRAVFVPAGEHMVRWEYRPGYLRPILLASLSVLVVAAIGLTVSLAAMLREKRAVSRGTWISAPNIATLLAGWVLLALMIGVLVGFTRAYWS
ncbi:MAG: hypothetical protein CL878_02940 [Dehalococcoidia bacterium]|nr:hypothetical protein [Dehalococcoidia bacterium]